MGLCGACDLIWQQLYCNCGCYTEAKELSKIKSTIYITIMTRKSLIKTHTF